VSKLLLAGLGAVGLAAALGQQQGTPEKMASIRIDRIPTGPSRFDSGLWVASLEQVDNELVELAKEMGCKVQGFSKYNATEAVRDMVVNWLDCGFLEG
jgi:hypothetical protein